ncbi:MAG: protein-L-isoaspartate(D-aspartate) O-methyltransferase, partial [Elusimicrobiota bacterium]
LNKFLPKVKKLIFVLMTIPQIFCSTGSTDMPSDEKKWEEERAQMVKYQIENRGIKDERVLKAMKSVPRHKFVPPEQVKYSYQDHPLPIGYGQTISQPYIVAFMTELLNLKKGEKVLEIGTGSGYQAAVLAEMGCKVFTVEIISGLAKSAQKKLAELNYTSVLVYNRDGFNGLPEHAPFDGIIVTAAAETIPQPLIKQLKPGGRMVIPVGATFEVQNLVLVKKDKKGKITTTSVLPVRFVPLTRELK